MLASRHSFAHGDSQQFRRAGTAPLQRYSAWRQQHHVGQTGSLTEGLELPHNRKREVMVT